MLEVAPGSPSHIAGFQPQYDYLLGTAERVFKNPDILFEAVTAHLDQPMAFYVYNTKTDEVRPGFGYIPLFLEEEKNVL